MTLESNDVKVSVGNKILGVGKLTFNSSVGIEDFGVLGESRANKRAINAPTTNRVNFNYLPSLPNDPLINYIRDVKSGIPANSTPLSIMAANFSGLFHMESFSIVQEPNLISEAEASFVGFQATVGDFSAPIKTGFANSIDLTSGVNEFEEGILNGLSVELRSDNQISDSEIVSFSYAGSFNLIPVFTIGQAIPKNVILETFKEEIQLQSIEYKKMPTTGELSNNYLDFDEILVCGLHDGELKPPGYESNSWSISLDDMFLQEQSTDLNLDSQIIQSTTFTKFF